jgi:hypothetical protein
MERRPGSRCGAACRAPTQATCPTVTSWGHMKGRFIGPVVELDAAL